MKILVTGSAGQLARELHRHDVLGQCTFAGRDKLDLLDIDGLESAVSAMNFDLLINAAAYTAVDTAETEHEIAHKLNAQAPGLLARVAASKGAPIVHISTDYVFDGTDPTPYQPDTATAPINAYGASKLAGEVAVAANNDQHLILRTSWVYSSFGANFVKTMLRLGADRDALSIVGDQHGSPTYAANLAVAILAIAPRLVTGTAPWGTYHYCDEGVTNWASFAEAIFEQSVELGLLDQAPKVTPIPASNYPTPAKRPEYSVLDCTSFDAAFADLRYPWQDSLQAMLNHLAKDGPA